MLNIINDLSIGGAEMMLYKLLANMDRGRFDPVVISLMDRGSLRQRIRELGISVYSPGMEPGLPRPASVWRFVRMVREIKPDVVHGWMYHGSLAAQLARSISCRKIPILWNIRNSVYSLAVEKRMTAAVIRLCSALSGLPEKIIFASRTSQSQHAAIGYRQENSCVISNGFDVSRFSPSDEARLVIRAELKLPAHAFLIGLVGRYHPMKDHANFLRAAALLSATHPDVHFLMVGRGVERENRGLYRLVQELGLTDRAHLLGERGDMQTLLAALDTLSLSSLYGESFPNIVGEAMACGVPCVVTDVGDSAWIVERTGRVVPPGDPDALFRAWKDLISIGQDGRAALGRAARSRVVQNFPIQLSVARYEALYEDVMVEEAAGEIESGGRSSTGMGITVDR